MSEVPKSPVCWSPNLISTPCMNNGNKDASQNSRPQYRKYPSVGSFPWSKNAKYSFGKYGDQFGTPSYPSPLDRIRKQERAHQLGLSPFERKECYEANQSLPPLPSGDTIEKEKKAEQTELKSKSFQIITGDSLHSYSFSPSCNRGTFMPSMSPSVQYSSVDDTLSESWLYYNFVGNTSAHKGSVFPTTVQNPNKAVLSIDSETKEILVVNKMACQMIGCSSSRIVNRKLDEFVKHEHQTQLLDEVEIDEETGEMRSISGKVVDLKDIEGSVQPVSIWIRKLASIDYVQRSLVVLEPVQRTTANILFDETGTIISCDSDLVSLHGYTSVKDVIGSKVNQIIPSLVIPKLKADQSLPKSLIKQSVTGRTLDNATFPLSIRISVSGTSEDCQDDSFLSGKSWTPLQHTSPGLKYHSRVNDLFTRARVGHPSAKMEQVMMARIEKTSLQPIRPDQWTARVTNSSKVNLLSQSNLPSSAYESTGINVDNISALFPTFYDDADFLDTDSMPLPPFDGDDDDHSLSGLCDSRNSEYSPVISPPRPPNPVMKGRDDCLVDDALENLEKLSLGNSNLTQSYDMLKSQSNEQLSRPQSQAVESDESSPTQGQENVSSCSVSRTDDDHSTVNAMPNITVSTSNIEFENNNNENNDKISLSKGTRNVITSDPNVSVESTVINSEASADLSASNLRRLESEDNKYPTIPEGNFFGFGTHRDGAEIAISYQIKRVELENGRTLYCLWVSKDPEEPAEGGRTHCSLTLASSFNSSVLDASTSSLYSLQDQSRGAVKPENDQLDGSCMSLNKSIEADSVYAAGVYGYNYTILKQIGKGAFGCVKMAFRNSDNLLVITKFIRKSKVYKDCWITDPKTETKIPLEISLLSTLSHPNIVKILDVYENDKYYQMVMEKHGSGMDLFEFIDRGPRLDEPLTSYIFRQVVEAVAYLHSLNILHRDIKDENIILDCKFHVKLIDFGSASLMTEGHLFSTFCGTMEYCSPEVLLGNRYRGPELEAWALGITLFTLVFGENPFYDAEESIAAKLLYPFQVSNELKDFISRLLHPDPVQRITLSQTQEIDWLHQKVDIDNYSLENIIHASAEELNPSKYYPRENSSQNDLLIQQLQKMQLNAGASDSSINDSLLG
ncbi:PAS domain-containing serine/threonine-protein kinase [Nymphon striatum]|nr:PAS domain-containing serine/threonine-protein kinase [Nymphon striatum]